MQRVLMPGGCITCGCAMLISTALSIAGLSESGEASTMCTSRPPRRRVTGTCSDPDRDAHIAFLPRHRTPPALPVRRPASTGWTAYAVAVLNVFAVPSTHRATITSEPRPRRRLPPASDAISVLGFLPGMAIHDIGIAEPGTVAEPTRPTTEASADPR